MQQSLISKYQPRTFDNYVIDRDILDLLQETIKLDMLNLLLISPSGCGKTSLLRTLVKTYFAGHPKAADNIMRISSVKEQGVAYFRTEVRTFCQSLSSIPSKKRIVVLDDIDLISEQSQQVFRNCIDKYNNNVHFIGSCCDPRRVIESLQSRLTSVTIPPLDKTALHKILDKIVSDEQIDMDDDVKQYLVDISGVSARTLINYLEKMLILNKHIDIEIANSLCTDIPCDLYDTYLGHCRMQNLPGALTLLNDLHQEGFSVMDILNAFFIYMKSKPVCDDEQFYKIMPLLCKHIIAFTDIHEHPIELAFFTASVLKIFQNIS